MAREVNALMRYSADLADRALYRRDLHRAAQRGLNVLRRFLDSVRDLFAEEEWTRVLKQLRVHGDNLARLTDHKFRSYRGEAHDPQIDGNDYPTVIEVLITPHRFLRHALSLTSGG